MSTYEVHEAALRAALAEHGFEGRDHTGAAIGGRVWWSILLYCDEESHNREKPWDIGDFQLIVDHGYPLPVWSYQQRGRRRRSGGYRRRSGTSAFDTNAQHLIGNRLLPNLHNAGEFDISKVDVRYPLRCGKCDLSLPWRRRHMRGEDKLQIELDKRAIAGVSQVALSELVAILK